MKWQPIETAPKGSGENGPDRTDAPDYEAPPRILLLVDGRVEVGAYDWYYHEGYGNGAHERDTAWVHSGGDVAPTHWMDSPTVTTLKGAQICM